MSVVRGEVVLLDFPQAPGQPAKRRPAVVVQSDANNTRLANAIFAMVSSNTRFAHEPAEVFVDISTPDGSLTGLTHASVIKCENLYTLPQSCVLRTIGTLSDPLLTQLDAALKASLGLQ